MAATYILEKTTVDGFPALRLVSPKELAATYVPTAGMICCSLTHRGEELLGQRRGLKHYAATGSTMGIPFLHPWANRLSRLGYEIQGKRVDFPPDSPLLHLDAKGLPMHGLVGGCPDWQVSEQAADQNSARLTARLDLTTRPEFLALFPFPHFLELKIVLQNTSLAVSTTVLPATDAAVPIAFGYHPYFTLPDIPRQAWEIEIPARRQLLLNDKALPTGETEPCPAFSGTLGSRVYDDLYTEMAPPPIFRLRGGGRTLTVSFGEGYRFAQIFAPGGDEVICFEPMTAPTNPFDLGDFVWVKPGSPFTASFEISVEAH
jgi:galactose mutarotase-like enzyme